MRGRRHGHDRRGHSLLELLAAVAITAILVLLIAQVISSVMGMWLKGKNRIRKNMDARAVLELMVQDVQAVVIDPSSRRIGVEWFQRRTDTGLQSEGGYDPGNAAVLMFFSSPPDRSLSSGGDVTALAYRLGYEESFAGPNGGKLYGLYRTLIPADQTFQNVLGKGDLWTDFWSAQDTRAEDNFLAAHVVEFRATFRALNPDGSFVEIDATPDLRLADTLAVDPAPAGLDPEAKLYSMDLFITLISEEGAKRIRQSGVDMQNILLQETHSYTRRVPINY